MTRDHLMTAKSCSNAESARDERMVAFIKASPAASLDGDRLVLTTATTRIDLLDRRVADPDRPLVGRTWRVVTIENGWTASPGAQKATLDFSQDGTVTIDTGCNVGSARYAISGDSVQFTNISLTTRGCPADGEDTENVMLAVLRTAAVTLRIEANLLELSTPGPAIRLVTE